MGIDITQWRQRIGLNSQPLRSISRLDTLKIGSISLFIRVLLFLLLATQCVETNGKRIWISPTGFFPDPSL